MKFWNNIIFLEKEKNVEDGTFDYFEIDSLDIFNYDSKIEALKKFLKSNHLNEEDYDLDSLEEDDDIYYDVEDYDFGNNFTDIELSVFNDDEALEIVEKYKKD